MDKAKKKKKDGGGSYRIKMTLDLEDLSKAEKTFKHFLSNESFKSAYLLYGTYVLACGMMFYWLIRAVPPYLRGLHSKAPTGCLKSQIVPNPNTMSLPIHICIRQSLICKLGTGRN